MINADKITCPDTEIGRMVYQLYHWAPGYSYLEKCTKLGKLIGDGVSYKTVQYWLAGKSGKNPARIKEVRRLFSDWQDSNKTFFVERLHRLSRKEG